MICDGTMCFARDNFMNVVNDATLYGHKQNMVTRITNYETTDSEVESPDKDKRWMTCKFTSMVEFELCEKED